MMHHPLPTDEMLKAVLEPQLSRKMVGPVSIRRIDRKPFEYATSCAIEELEVHIESLAPLQILFKDLTEVSPAGSTSQTRPSFMYDPTREIMAYRDVLDSAELGTAEPFGWVSDESASRYWLFLEHVRGDMLWQIGDLEPWKDAARWLGRFHQLEALQQRAATLPLLRRDAAYHRRWLQRARDLRPRESALWSIGPAYDLAVALLGRLPATLIHGEFYPSNIVVWRGSDPIRICPIDWELTSLSPGVIDLAALVSGWEETEETLLIEAYREGLAIQRAAPSIDELRYSVWCSRLIQCVQWVGWSNAWTPPPEHRRDWLSEAMTLSDRLSV